MQADELQIPTCCSQDFALIFAGEYDIPMSRPPKTVLDIGANVGMFTVYAARKWPDAEIVACEPWTENVQMLRANTASYPQVTVIPSAVREKAGVSQMWENGYSPLHSFHIDMGVGEVRSVECVPASLLRSAEFVKIDTEGSEVEIIEHLDLSQTKWIALEAHNRVDANRIIEFLTARDFALHNMFPAGSDCLLLKFIRRSEIDAEPRLFVAVPTYGGSPTRFWQCLMRLAQRPPCHVSIKTVDGDSLVARARNTLTAAFMASDCSHILFIDSDLIFSPEHVGRIMEHSEPVVAGFYPKKQDGKLHWVCNAKSDVRNPDERGLQEVRYMGTGFIRVAREVFLRMIEAYGDKIQYHPDSVPMRIEYDFWPVGVYRYPDGNCRYLSEDWFFCQRWMDLGGKVFGDTRIVLKHIGTASYPLLSQVDQISQPIDAELTAATKT